MPTKRNNNSTKKVLLLATVVSTLFLLIGCSGKENHKDVEHTGSQTEKTSEIEGEALKIGNSESQILTFYPEDSLSSDVTYYGYNFSGYPDDNHIQFERVGVHTAVTSFYPAEVGHTFKFKYMKSKQFEIIEINPKENYLKVKVTEAR